MKELHGVLFDLDGVIVDTAKYHYEAWKRLAENFDIELTEAMNESLKGVSRVDSLDRILKMGNVTLDAETKTHWLEQKNNWYLEYVKQMDAKEILPGVRAMLWDLKDAKIGIALGSASKNAPLILDVLGITPFFDAVIDGNTVSRSKPDPQVFEKGAEALEISPETTVVFEDAIAGIRAAKAAGMCAIGVSPNLGLHEADHQITGFDGFTLTQLLEIIGVVEQQTER